MMDNHNGAIRGLAFGSISIDEKSCYVGDHKKLPAPKYQALPMLANGASYPDQADQALQAETPKDEHNFEYIAIVIDGDTEISTDVDMEHFANHRKSVTPGGFSIQKPLLGSKSPLEIGNAVVSILERYRQVPKTRRPQAWQAREKFLTLIQEHVERGEAIPMVLPAFPFKSPNKTYKVLGRLPDKAEELALLHLDELCKEIGEVYHNGAKIDIVSDGLMYNDVLGISDKEVWTYGQALRKLAIDKSCDRIQFVRLVHLLGEAEVGEPLTEEEYLRDAAWFRTQLYQKNIPDGFDTSKHIASDYDATLTYRGYIKFLEKDIDDGRFENKAMSNKQMKKHREEIAKKMIARGRVFAIAIAKKFEKSIRLSIHPSADVTKLSISLIPQTGGTPMTPWHSCLVQWANGNVELKHAGAVSEQTHELIYENGRPSYFRERSDLLNWETAGVGFQYLYPRGILVSASKVLPQPILRISDLHKAMMLAHRCSPVILKGFSAMEQKLGQGELGQETPAKPAESSSQQKTSNLAWRVSEEEAVEPIRARTKPSQSLHSQWKRVGDWGHGCTTV